ncbi:MAG: response regulator [Gammaproteobacteria bacterium]|nr:response regulator [Gammaproteobacteria bacterium]
MTDTPIKDRIPAATPAVLVVDDNELVRSLVVGILENAGLTVLAADAGPTAIELVRTGGGSIGCVLQDLSMPGMSGDAVILEMLKLNPDLPIVVYSAEDEVAATLRLTGLKIAGYIQKPFEAEQLVTTIRGLVEAVV